MAQIFISYRRSDSTAITGRIYDRLRQEFGKDAIFKDVDNIPAGRDFRGVLREATANCGVMLVIIGPNWVNATDAQGNHRLDDMGDFVRLEVETGLQRDDVRVIPLLLNNAPPPKASDLPDTLKELAYNNAMVVRDDPDFHRDMDRIIEEIKGPLKIKRVSPRKLNWALIIPGVLIPLIVAVIGSIPFLSGRADATATQNAVSTLDAQTQIAQALTPSETLPPSATLTPLPTLDATQIEGTIQSQMLMIQTEANATIDAQQTATAGFATAFAQQTRNVESTINANGTATANTYMDTPTPDTRLTAETRLKQTQAIIDMTTTVDSWTDTPTSTNTFIPSSTPTITYTPFITPTKIPLPTDTQFPTPSATLTLINTPRPTQTPVPSTPTSLTQNGLIAFIRDNDIYTMKMDGSDITRLTTGGFNSDLAWSPDGKQIAFTSYQDQGEKAYIYVMQADGSNVTPLITEGKNYTPSWSPDGKQIAFTSLRNGVYHIYLMDLDGGSEKRLRGVEDDISPIWSPDGKQIVFTSSHGVRQDIFRMNSDGTGATRLTTEGFYYSPALSPDGSLIAFIGRVNNRYNIYIMNSYGSEITKLTTGESAAWSLDGKHIIFSSDYDIYIMKMDGSEIKRLIEDGYGPVWQPSP